jgi:large subunit ribosomal protein L19
MANNFNYKGQQLNVGDSISVNYRLKEGDKERIQAFKGIIIKIRGASENDKMFTVRKMSRSGIGVERIFPLTSPFIDSIKLEKKATGVRRAKIYFIRNLTTQQIKASLYKTKKNA